MSIIIVFIRTKNIVLNYKYDLDIFFFRIFSKQIIIQHYKKKRPYYFTI